MTLSCSSRLLNQLRFSLSLFLFAFMLGDTREKGASIGSERPKAFARQKRKWISFGERYVAKTLVGSIHRGYAYTP